MLNDDDDDGHDEDDYSEDGWNANYAWTADFGVPAADYDFAAGHATLDTAGLLLLLPATGVNGIRAVTFSPAS